jgi:elongation of very long chain fatty acids protein 6
MYMYFFLMALHAVPRWFNPKWLTVAQISQMFVGLYVIGASTYYKFYTPRGCAIEPGMVVAIWLMYATYLYLFVDFFVKRFGATAKKRKAKAEAAAVNAGLQQHRQQQQDEAERAKYKAQ